MTDTISETLGRTTRWLTIGLIALLSTFASPRMLTATGQFERPVERLAPSDVRTIDGTAEWVLVEYRRDGCWMCERFEADTLPAFKREFVATGKMAFATIDVTAEDLLGVPLKFGSPPRLFIGTRTPDGGVDVRF